MRLSNPSSKPLTYKAILAGHDAEDFSLPKGFTVTLGPRSTYNLGIEFTSRFLRPAEAVLVLVGHRHGSQVGTTLVFKLHTQIDQIVPKVSTYFTKIRTFIEISRISLILFYELQYRMLSLWLTVECQV